jgi:peptide/nickel transport system substrate-binding protein
VQFHSGNTMTCADVAWSIKYGLITAAPEGATSYLVGKQFLGSQQTGDDVEAFLAANTWEAIDGAVTCPDGPDGLVADLNIQSPDPAFMAVLAYTAFSVIDSEYAIANGVWDGTEATWQDWIGRDLTEEFLHRNPSGTGAYKLVEWGDATLIATRFDAYWGGAPQIENVVYNYVDEEATRILALQQGDADRIRLGQRASLVQVAGHPASRSTRSPTGPPPASPPASSTSPSTPPTTSTSAPPSSTATASRATSSPTSTCAAPSPTCSTRKSSSRRFTRAPAPR